MPSNRLSWNTIFVLLLSFLIFLPQAHAYHTDEHELITHQAVLEINTCYPGLISEQAQALLIEANLNEDYNIFLKDIWYSHYYNPFKNLHMRRYDSAVRVQRLRDSLPQWTSELDKNTFLTRLGHLIHHLQDATVPPHVVPVSHAFFDGFETFSFKGDISTGLTCSELRNQASAADLELLRETAATTLNNIQRIHWPISATSAMISLPSYLIDGKAFWVEGDKDEFGQYGYLGNNFGQTTFTKGRFTYRIPIDSYNHFKQSQLRLAVKTTALALLGQIVGN